MNLRAFAQQIVTDPVYRQSLLDRAKAGTLPPDVEELIWSIADVRVPLDRPAPPRPRTPTLAFQAPRLSADELEARTQAAALDGDVALTAYYHKERTR